MNIIDNIKIILEAFSPAAKEHMKRFGIGAAGAATGSVIGHHIGQVNWRKAAARELDNVANSEAGKKITDLLAKIQQYK